MAKWATRSELAREYGVSHRTIRRLLHQALKAGQLKGACLQGNTALHIEDSYDVDVVAPLFAKLHDLPTPISFFAAPVSRQSAKRENGDGAREPERCKAVSQELESAIRDAGCDSLYAGYSKGTVILGLDAAEKLRELLSISCPTSLHR